MENSAYEECADLMNFYEVYCSAKTGEIQTGDPIGGLIFVLSIAALLALIYWAEKA